MSNEIIMMPIERLCVDSANMRAEIPINKRSEEYRRLYNSIKANGIKDPIGVRPDPEREGYYMVYKGKHRYEVGLDVGLKEMPCIIKHLSNEDAWLESTAENIKVRKTFYTEICNVAKGARSFTNSPINIRVLSSKLGYSENMTRNLLNISKLPYEVLIFTKEFSEITKMDRETTYKYFKSLPHRPNHPCLSKFTFCKLGTLWNEKVWGREHICTSEELLYLVIFLIYNKFGKNEVQNFIQFCEKQMRHNMFVSPDEAFRDYRPVTHSKKAVTIFLDPIIYGKLAGEALRSHRHIRLIVEEAIAKYLGSLLGLSS